MGAGQRKRGRSWAAAGLQCLLLAGLVGVGAPRPQRADGARAHGRHARGQPAADKSDFAPKLTHQPHSVQVEADKPHTVECPVEAQPDADVKWFKDDQLVASEPTHLEQTGAELMFFQIAAHDAGLYHCQASNYLGSVTSERFRLQVQTSAREPPIRLEPRLTEVRAPGAGQVELTCKLGPAAKWPRARHEPEPGFKGLEPGVVWRRNGRPLAVAWAPDSGPDALDELTSSEPDGSSVSSSSSSSTNYNNNNDDDQARHRFTARQSGPAEFVLTIGQLQPITDNNTVFTCAASTAADPELEPSGAELESNEARLQFAPQASLASGPAPEPPAGGQLNKTTQLAPDEAGPARPARTLAELLDELLAVSRGSLTLVALFGLVALLVLLQVLFLRRRARENRYMKHHQYHSGAASSSSNSSGSGTSSALGSSLDCDPVLSSLLGRTLSAPSAAGSLAGGASKKYRSYRDHMRKVAAGDLGGAGCDAQLVHHQPAADFMDLSYSGHHQRPAAPANQEEPFANFARAQLALPNLYNQSLAARQQAQALLKQRQHQANEHLKSLGNLATVAGNQKHCPAAPNKNSSSEALNRHHHQQPHHFPGSHLNLAAQLEGPNHGFSVTDGNNQLTGALEAGAGQLLSSSIWPPHLIQFAGQRGQQFGRPQHHQQQQQQQPDEHYQLVSCSSGSPSSPSSAAGSSLSAHRPHGAPSDSPSGAASQPLDLQQLTGNRKPAHNKHHQLDSSISNHYSTIETNEDDEDDDDDRYEELSDGRPKSRGQPRAGPEPIQDSATDLSEPAPTTNGAPRFGSKRLGSSRTSHARQVSSGANQSARFQDQLSPYAVSSICDHNGLQQQQQQQQQQQSLPPPVNSEAMQALNEQFDLSHLMMLDESHQQDPSVPFQDPPPPPPPPPSSSDCPTKCSSDRTSTYAANKHKRPR